MAPRGILIVNGTSAPHLHLSCAALFTRAFIANAAKPPNCISATGLIPPNAAPVAELIMIDSERGISRSLLECPFALRGIFIPKAPATSISSPMNTISFSCLSANATIAFCIARLYVEEFGALENSIAKSPSFSGPDKISLESFSNLSNCSV